MNEIERRAFANCPCPERFRGTRPHLEPLSFRRRPSYRFVVKAFTGSPRRDPQRAWLTREVDDMTAGILPAAIMTLTQHDVNARPLWLSLLYAWTAIPANSSPAAPNFAKFFWNNRCRCAAA